MCFANVSWLIFLSFAFYLFFSPSSYYIFISLFTFLNNLNFLASLRFLYISIVPHPFLSINRKRSIGEFPSAVTTWLPTMFPKMAMTNGSVWEREHIDRVGFKGVLILKKKKGSLHLFGWGGKGKRREKTKWTFRLKALKVRWLQERKKVIHDRVIQFLSNHP